MPRSPILLTVIGCVAAWTVGVCPAQDSGLPRQDVTIQNAGYTPQVIRILPDTDVIWTNLEGVHTTTSRDGLWDSGVLVTDDTFSYFFDTLGVYHYYDTINGWPSGTIQVVYSLAEIGVSVDKALYASGDVMNVGLEITNPGETVVVGIRIWLETPDGSRIWLLRRPAVTLPAGMAFSSEAWRTYTLPPLPRGDYTLGAEILKMPEQDPISGDRAAFTFGLAVQTDWSGGPAGAAPAGTWGRGFEEAQGQAWRSITGQVSIASPSTAGSTGTVVTDEAGMPTSVASGDLDGDGQVDLITTDPVYDVANALGAVYWWRRLVTGIWIQAYVSDDFYGAHHVGTADVDGDGDLDVIAAAFYGDDPDMGRNGKFAWFENLNGDASAWTGHVVGDDFWGADYVDAGDLDGDGDVDLVGASSLTEGVYEQESDLTWFENLDGAGQHWGQHDLDLAFDNANEVHVADLDGDADLDLVGAYADDSSQSRFAWWENVNGDGTVWTKRWIPGEFWGAGYCAVGDIDGDGDPDLLGSGYNTGQVGWWENLDGTGTSWQSWYVTARSEGRGSALYDLDGDGDLDAVIWSLGAAIWVENIDGYGNSWSQHSFPVGFDMPWAAAADVNNDGKLEIVVTSEDSYPPDDDQVVSFDVSTFGTAGRLTGNILDGDPAPGWGAITWDANLPPGTFISVKVRASNDSGEMGDFITVPVSGTDLGELIDPDARYLQYQVNMRSTDPERSPVLLELAVEKGDSAERCEDQGATPVTVQAPWSVSPDGGYGGWLNGAGVTSSPKSVNTLSPTREP